MQHSNNVSPISGTAVPLCDRWMFTSRDETHREKNYNIRQAIACIMINIGDWTVCEEQHQLGTHYILSVDAMQYGISTTIIRSCHAQQHVRYVTCIHDRSRISPSHSTSIITRKGFKWLISVIFYYEFSTARPFVAMRSDLRLSSMRLYYSHYFVLL